VYQTQNQREKDAIKQFSQFATKHSKLEFNLLALHPVDIEEIKVDPCSVSLSDYEHQDIVME
jgi:hypothetical protein